MRSYEEYFFRHKTFLVGVHSKASMSGRAGCRGPQAGGEGNPIIKIHRGKYVVCIMYVYVDDEWGVLNPSRD